MSSTTALDAGVDADGASVDGVAGPGTGWCAPADVTAAPVDVSDEIAGLAGALNLTNARLTAVMSGVLESGVWSGPGIRSPRQWLEWKAGVSAQRATDIVKVASRRAEFPVLVEAFDAGRLSFEQMAVLVDAPAWADEQLLYWGTVATVRRLKKTIRARFFTGDRNEPDEPAPEPEDRDRVSTRVDDDDRWHVNGELDVGRGATVDAALIEARERLWERGQTSISTADCLVEIAEHYLDGTTSPARRERSKTWVHLDVTDGTAATTDGWRLPDAVRDRLTCDGVVQPVWETDGLPFSVGRSQRIVPERTRRLIERRDQGCRVPGCANDRFVEIHHVVHWLDGGPTDTSNLISLCPHHHRLHHQDLLGIAGDADEPNGVVFTDQRGDVVDPVGRPDPPGAPPPPPEPCYRPPLMGRVDYSMLGWSHPNNYHPLARASLGHTPTPGP